MNHHLGALFCRRRAILRLRGSLAAAAGSTPYLAARVAGRASSSFSAKRPAEERERARLAFASLARLLLLTLRATSNVAAAAAACRLLLSDR